MQILSIHLKNIKSHRDTELTFSPGINVLSGPNGVGKSTVFEAIGYALFGVDARDFVSNVDRFLTIGAKKGEISVTFKTDSGDVWRVNRTVGTPAKWLLSKESGGSFEVEEHARIEETEARITELLGLASGRPLAEQFKLVIGPFQNDFLGPFIIKQPTKRQEAFDEILGIDAWRKTFKGTSSLLAAVQEKIKVLNAEVSVKQDQLTILPQKETELVDVKESLERKDNELKGKESTLAELKVLLFDLDGREKAINAIVAEIQVIEGRVKDGGEKIATQKTRVKESETAHSVVEDSRKGKEAYDKAEERLAELRNRELLRRAVELEINGLEKEALRLSQACEHEQKEVTQTEKQIGDEEAKLEQSRQALQPDEKLKECASALPELCREADLLKGEHSLQEGRRGGLVEGKDKLAEGTCPFFQEQCLNVADRKPQDVFTVRLNDLDRAMAALDIRIQEASARVVEAEKAEKELHAMRVRLKELDSQAKTLGERRHKNDERKGLLEKLKEQQASASAAVADRKKDLQEFKGLDEEIKRTEQERKIYQAAYDAFTANLKVAEDLENRRQTLTKWQNALNDLEKTRIEKQTELDRSRQSYNPEQHQEVRRQKESFVAEVAALRQQIEDLGKNLKRLVDEIDLLKRIKEEIALKQAEIKSFESKEKLVKFLRNQVFKNVSSQLSERFREEISLRADRIYRTISEADEELIWGDDYRIVLRDMVDGEMRERTDDQLSGGQTMSSVVALRLALLQTIGARIAFFDEPTSNLDASRRENLAHAFRSIDVGREEVTEHWYDQLFLISHDVAFTEITDQIVQLHE